MRTYNSLQDIQKDIREGKTSCAQLVDFYISNIRQKAYLNAFLEVFEEEAREKAFIIDQKITSGQAGRLAGMVIGIKDVLCYENHALQCSSMILDGFNSQFTATCIERLIREDAIILGRTNCDEFAMGSSNENSAFGPVRNEIDPDRVPGGSSGGSAVAVQADLCLAALGTDTGGSVRQPAAFCGVIGLKPTYSRISRYGLTAYASSFDTLGILSRSIEDSALLLEIMSGKDEFDSTVSRQRVPPYLQNLAFDKKIRVACIRETLEDPRIDTEIRQATSNVLQFLEEDGHVVEEVSFPMLDYILPTYYILTTAEASSNLSRYDGVKYGFRSPNTTDMESMYKKSRTEGFGEEVKRRILLGTFVLSASYYDAYYTKAQKVRQLIKKHTLDIFKKFDFIVLPTTPTTAFKLGEVKNPLDMYFADLLTVQASVAGNPSISIPISLDGRGLPIGFQIMADYFEEEKLLAFANYLLRDSGINHQI
ncbi:MAG: Asp-tRNA(Asn)/Glu-tRNA(Gln) amidotransferase subunit GatA [Cyclobacteriaceae bacterium]|nr:Asp-tRNA(Asn)/Glu-tRNA(Gln) amidotransferase subunit GatA [Cyclobacteriaceae bacterium]